MVRIKVQGGMFWSVSVCVRACVDIRECLLAKNSKEELKFSLCKVIALKLVSY